MGDGVGLPDGVGGEEGCGCGVGELFGEGSATPLFQIIFLPDFIAVYFLPRQMIVCPRRVGLSEGPTVALEKGVLV